MDYEESARARKIAAYYERLRESAAEGLEGICEGCYRRVDGDKRDPDGRLCVKCAAKRGDAADRGDKRA